MAFDFSPPACYNQSVTARENMEVRAVRNGEFFDAGRHYRYLAPAPAEEERISVQLMSGPDNLRGVHCHDCLELNIVMAGHGTFFDRKIRRETLRCAVDKRPASG